MKRLSQLLLIGFLAGLMSLVTIPVEYIHALYHHQDSIDNLKKDQAQTLEQSHLHCLILKTEFARFLASAKLQPAPIKVTRLLLSAYYCNPLVTDSYSRREQRGPPFC
ncbi:MAG TPA: hypothetical protein VIH57_19825 [Bacteroidales bacterium]